MRFKKRQAVKSKAGTIITVFRKPSRHDFFDPIMQRLRAEETLLREDEDASMLLQAILDLGVPILALDCELILIYRAQWLTVSSKAQTMKRS